MLFWAISDCFHINAVWCQRIEKEYLKYIFLAGFVISLFYVQILIELANAKKNRGSTEN